MGGNISKEPEPEPELCVECDPDLEKHTYKECMLCNVMFIECSPNCCSRKSKMYNMSQIEEVDLYIKANFYIHKNTNLRTTKLHFINDYDVNDYIKIIRNFEYTQIIDSDTDISDTGTIKGYLENYNCQFILKDSKNIGLDMYITFTLRQKKKHE